MKPPGSGHLLFGCFLITVSISLLIKYFFSYFLFLPDSVLENSTFLRICLLLDCSFIGKYLLASVYYDPLYVYALSCNFSFLFLFIWALSFSWWFWLKVYQFWYFSQKHLLFSLLFSTVFLSLFHLFLLWFFSFLPLNLSFVCSVIFS